jgi:hypothetical protein
MKKNKTGRCPLCEAIAADSLGKQMRQQNPKIQKRKDVPRPFFYIRPVVPTVVRKQMRITLGFCDEMSKKEAKAAKAKIMAQINTRQRARIAAL